MPADLRHSVFRRLHGGGAGDHAGAAVIHFDECVTTAVARFVAGVKSGCRNPVTLPDTGEVALHCS